MVYYHHTYLQYVDDLIASVEHTGTGCFYKSTCISIVMYADDILLLSSSVTALQDLLHVCENVLHSLDLFINLKKSVCMRIDPRCNSVCCDIVSCYGHVLQWADSITYLGVHFVRTKHLNAPSIGPQCHFIRRSTQYMAELAGVALTGELLPQRLRGSNYPVDQLQMYAMLTVCIRGLSSK